MSSSRHLLRRLVGEEQGQLVDQPPEHLGVRMDVPEQAELVADERVPDLRDAHVQSSPVPVSDTESEVQRNRDETAKPLVRRRRFGHVPVSDMETEV